MNIGLIAFITESDRSNCMLLNRRIIYDLIYPLDTFYLEIRGIIDALIFVQLTSDIFGYLV